jgi:hypothetical protein
VREREWLCKFQQVDDDDDDDGYEEEANLKLDMCIECTHDAVCFIFQKIFFCLLKN